MANKAAKRSLPEDASYHIFHVDPDGRRLMELISRAYNNFDPGFLPDGRTVSLTTPGGQARGSWPPGERVSALRASWLPSMGNFVESGK